MRCWTGRICLYFHGARAGRKYGLLAQDRRVCVEGDLCHGFVENGHGGVTCNYESFIGYGRADFWEGLRRKRASSG
jgi:nitroimidazol reductase NimA-like FMN-containing flavoprotein (pyridoxamine 5'-phosphate oxidase superfamily)